jgi:hypothetical protein
MDWLPAPSRGGWIGLAALGAALGAEATLGAMAWRVFPSPTAAIIGLIAVLLVPSLLWLAYWVWGRLSLRYTLTRDGVVIRWAGHRQVIPMDAITHVLAGRAYETPLRGFRWPGHEVGHTRVALADDGGDPRDVLAYATTGPEGQIVVATSDVAYAISPADRAAFIDEFRVRRRLGSVQVLAHETVVAPWLAPSVWRDGVVIALIATGIVINAIGFAWLTWHYTRLPASVAFGYAFDPASGETIPGQLQKLSTAWFVPAIGLGALVANAILAAGIHRRAQLASRVLALGACLLQIAVVVSLVKLR